ncbi:MAG: hypothetical protein RL708_1716 [Bacteroidota bacterium]|jgi:hypothetical protein
MIEIQQHTFQKTLHDVKHLNDLSIGYLEQLTKQYPWFVSAHQLLAKKYQLLNHQNFNEQLQHAALLSYSRAELFNLIETDITPKVIEIPKIEIKKEEKRIESKSEMVQEKIVSAPLIEDKKIEKVVVGKIEFVAEKVEPKIEVAETIISKVEKKSEPIFKDEVIEKPILMKSEIEKKKIEAPKQIVEKEFSVSNKMKMNSSKVEETPKSFTSWLKKYSKGSKVGEEKMVEQKPVAPKKSDFISKIEDGYDDNDENEVDDLKINLAELSSFSMQQHDEFVTETMAKIYVEQEKFDKAISTYEKLSLLKPEKSVFFASRIVEINNKIKQQ